MTSWVWTLINSCYAGNLKKRFHRAFGVSSVEGSVEPLLLRKVSD